MAYGGHLATNRRPSYWAMSLEWYLLKCDIPLKILDTSRTPPRVKYAEWMAEGQV